MVVLVMRQGDGKQGGSYGETHLDELCRKRMMVRWVLVVVGGDSREIFWKEWTTEVKVWRLGCERVTLGAGRIAGGRSRPGGG